VTPGSYSHLTEFFGPVLGVMRFQTLREAVNLVNQTGYGLTSGIESLDEREVDYWREHVRAGNLYINRVTTGAIVLRQPFGGCGKSVFGPSMKAGGPNYVAQFMDFSDTPRQPVKALPESESLKDLCVQLLAHGPSAGISRGEIERIVSAATSYEHNLQQEFGQQHDHFRLIGQDNFRRYRPLHEIRVQVHAADTAFDLFARVCAIHALGGRITISAPPNLESKAVKLLETLTESWAGGIEFVEETDAELAQAMREHQTDRLRYAAPDRVPLEVLRAAAESFTCVISTPVVMEGRLELLWYVQEQSISADYHRYGNLGTRAAEQRTEPA
jgi:RHH-type proline utilization regulon transcriptional repressor/proline dehydrogenase/delta 1-pyrroline-5-carboxylate dehydrogenase